MKTSSNRPRLGCKVSYRRSNHTPGRKYNTNRNFSVIALHDIGVESFSAKPP
jgi:hypothetical protein